MSKNNISPELAKKIAAEEEAKSKELKPDYTSKGTKSDAGEIPLTQESIGEKSKEAGPKGTSLFKKVFTPQGLFEKAYRNIHGASKHYVKLGCEQKEIIDPVTKLEIIVYADGKECSYFENLTQSEIESHNLF